MVNVRGPIVALLLAGTLAPLAAADVREEGSVLAVITHKAGFASGLAHDHLIVAGEDAAELEFDRDAPLATRFHVEIEVDDLVVDDPELQRRWFPRLQELGVLDEPFRDLEAKQRDKIRREMRGKGQLHAAAHPRIVATVVEVRPDDDDDFPYAVELALEVRGRRVVRVARARTEAEGDAVRIEALARFRFTDFGIEPYSAFLGAVRNRDGFDVYASLVVE